MWFRGTGLRKGGGGNGAQGYLQGDKLHSNETNYDNQCMLCSNETSCYKSKQNNLITQIILHFPIILSALFFGYDAA